MKAKLTVVLQIALAGGIILFANQNVAKADEIDDLVTNLSNTNRLWSWNSGTTLNIHLPETASPQDVIKRLLDFDLPKEKEANYKILVIRQVPIPPIPNGLRPDIRSYTAAIVLRDGSKKIVLFAYWGSAFGWWSRVYDFKSEAIGHIDLSVKDAKCESEFVWPTNRSPEIVLECSDINAEPLLTHPHTPFIVQVEITDMKSGQMVVSNSIVQPFIIRTDDYTNVFQAGNSYILDLQVLQETKGLGIADVYFKR